MISLPDNLAPECYPLAWLVDTWAGGGLVQYEGIETSAFIHELSITNEGETPYLRVTSTTWIAKEAPHVVDKEASGLETYKSLTKDYVWSSLTGFLRPVPDSRQEDGTSGVEGVFATGSGHSMLFAGIVNGPRFSLISDTIIGAPSASQLDGAKLMVGLVASDLFYAYDMEAFGKEMQSYLSGRLSRVGALMAASE